MFKSKSSEIMKWPNTCHICLHRVEGLKAQILNFLRKAKRIFGVAALSEKEGK
jgi:hypothetical protein